MADLLAWYTEHKKQIRTLAFTTCPTHGRQRLAVAFAHEGRRYLWEAGYRMTIDESNREAAALLAGRVWESDDRPPSARDLALIERLVREHPERFITRPRVWPLTEQTRVSTTCRSCGVSYLLDGPGLAARSGHVPPARRQTIDGVIDTRLDDLDRGGAVQRSDL